jgi:hypothetical protein
MAFRIIVREMRQLARLKVLLTKWCREPENEGRKLRRGIRQEDEAERA